MARQPPVRGEQERSRGTSHRAAAARGPTCLPSMASRSLYRTEPLKLALLDTFCFPIDLNFTPDRVGNVARVMGSTMQTFNFPCSGSAFSLKYYARTQRDLCHPFLSFRRLDHEPFFRSER